MNLSKLAVAAAALTSATSSLAAAVNLVRDGSFEDIYVLSQWNRNWTSPFVVEWTSVPAAGGPTDGIRHVRFTEFGIGSEISLFQTIETTPGDRYDLSFDAASLVGFKQFSVSWTALGQPSQNFVIPRQTLSNTQYQTFELPLIATSAASVLRFSFYGEFDSGYLDNISLTEAQAVPEPASWALLIAGLGLMCSRSGRRGLAQHR